MPNAELPDALPQLAPRELPEAMREAGHGAGPELAAAIAHAWEHSPFLRSLMRQRPELVEVLAARGADAVIDDAHALVREGDAPVGTRLRRARGGVALAVALADLAGWWPLERVVGALSAFADLTLGAAIRAAIAERVPGAGPEGFVALALGKLGSRELNYSSDIDLILLFDREHMPRRARDDADEAAVRIGRRVSELLQARDAQGYVFRVDLRLRPSPEATPIALPVHAAESYYQSEALPWERAAFIRSRACAGDLALGEAFLQAIAPFVWRRSLDYQAIREVEDISLRIRDHFEAGQQVGPGFDLKRGRGGIREIEFFAQTYQMIFGGRDPSLRVPATLDALGALAAASRVEEQHAAALSRAYRYLRAAEHRLQMIADEQTQRVPEDAAARENYARFAGYADWDAMAEPLGRITAEVAHLYDGLAFGRREEAVPRDPEALGAWLEGAGFAEAEDVARLVAGWRGGSARALRSPVALSAFEAVLPRMLRALADAVEPRSAAARFDRFLGKLPAGVGLFSLLQANPSLVGLLGRLLGVTPMLADALARNPSLFDVLLDPAAFDTLPPADALETELRASVARARGTEDELDRVRRWTAERRFQVGTQLIDGRIDPLDAARAYGALADAALAVLAELVERDFAERHGRVAGGELLVVALGRYGGGALTARSDLDLVYLYAGEDGAQSDGAKPLPTSLYFNRLAPRLSAALSVPTAAGALYEVDTRLRPSGSAGMLAVSVEAFARYQREEAWTAEHMALTRARVVVGSAGRRAEVERAVADVLDAPRDPAKLVADALELRALMQKERPGGGLFDVKLGPGGLVDLEFVVQVTRLRSGVALPPELGAATRELERRGLVRPELAAAHDLMARVLVVMRLVFEATHGPTPTPPPAALQLLARLTGLEDEAGLVAGLHKVRAVVMDAWRATFGVAREEER